MLIVNILHSAFLFVNKTVKFYFPGFDFTV